MLWYSERLHHNSHVLRGHFELVLAEREHPTQSDVGRRDEMLTRRQQFEVVTLLQDRTVVRGDVQATKDKAGPVNTWFSVRGR